MNTASEQRVGKKNTVRGVELDVSLPRTVQLGRKVEITVVLTNKGSESVHWAAFGRYRGCKVRVFDSQGDECGLTPYGESQMGGNWKGTHFGFVHHPLEPGQSHAWRYDLLGLFDLMPGDHTLSASSVLNIGQFPFEATVDGIGLTISR